MKESDIEFLKTWIKGLDILYPEIRKEINRLCSIFDDRFITINQAGELEICRKEDNECKNLAK